MFYDPNEERRLRTLAEREAERRAETVGRWVQSERRRCSAEVRLADPERERRDGD